MVKSFGIAVLLVCAAATAARAELRSPEATVSLGEVRSGVRRNERFRLVNDGSASVQILEVKTTCGCMKPRLSKETLAAGEAGELTLEINTLSAAAGLQSWRARVLYREAGATKELTLVVTGRVIREVTVEPTSLALIGERGSVGDITITDLRQQALAIRAVETTSPSLLARLDVPRHDVQGHSTHIIHLEIGDGFTEGRHEEALDIVTDDATYGTLRVPVVITKKLRQRVAAAPDSVKIRAAAGQPLPSRILLLRDSENEQVVIERIAADHPALQCKWASGPGNAATVRISMDRTGLATDRLQANVHIILSKPVSQTMVIPVTLTPDS
jgi:hypothetical protein